MACFQLPTYYSGRAARLSNGLVYFVGGANIDDKLTYGTTYIFNPATNSTLAGAQLNVPCYNMGKQSARAAWLTFCHLLDLPKLSESPSRTGYPYWTAKIQAPDHTRTVPFPCIARRFAFGMTVINDTIIVCGGYLPVIRARLDACEQFTVTQDGSGDGHWTFMPTRLPYRISDLAMVAVGSKLYAIGGLHDTCTRSRDMKISAIFQLH